MRSFLVQGSLLAGVLLMVSFSGCAARKALVEPSAGPPTMTKEDVVNMVTSGISDTLIIAQIQATNSRFQLSVPDIVEMKKAGVSDIVIDVMIRTAQAAPSEERGRTQRYYVPRFYWVSPFPYRPFYFYDPFYDPFWIYPSRVSLHISSRYTLGRHRRVPYRRR